MESSCFWGANPANLWGFIGSLSLGRLVLAKAIVFIKKMRENAATAQGGLGLKFFSPRAFPQPLRQESYQFDGVTGTAVKLPLRRVNLGLEQRSTPPRIDPGVK